MKVAGTTGWLVLAAAWVIVMWRGAGPSAGMVASPFLLMLGAGALMAVWVRHNISLQQRRGPRRAVPAVAPVYATDRLGRALSVDDTPASAPRWVQIYVEVRPDRKHYLRP
jgi:hypothetical protein